MVRGIFDGPRHRGVVTIIAMLLFIVLIGAAALAVDMSMLVSAKSQEQVAADNCALATAWFIANQGLQADAELRAQVSARASEFGTAFLKHNPVDGVAVVPLAVETGRVDRDQRGRVTRFLPDATDYDAVRVSTVVSLPALFGVVFGKEVYKPLVSAVSLLDMQNGAVLPFTLSQRSFDEQMAAASDQWTWDASLEVAVPGPDGVPELVLFPAEDNEAYCAGNFGALNVSDSNLGASKFAVQVQDGLSAEEIASVLGPLEVAFSPDPWLDAHGNRHDLVVGHFIDGDMPYQHHSIDITGNPGLSVSESLEQALQSRIGDIIGYFIHADCANGGSNGTYSTIEIRSARLLAFNLNSNPKRIVIQPSTEKPNLISKMDVLGLGM